MSPTPPTIRALDIDKSFGRTRAVAGASLEVASGELVALLGPSGSGKTTLLRVVAGFEEPDAGTVEIAGRLVAGNGTWVEPERRRVGMVFQDGALFPHLTVARNLAFGRPAAGRAEECLELVGLAHKAGAYPHELSGGERQRVALARALAIDPTVVLLDEPFAALDAGLRASLRLEVAQILREAGASALLVTHDQQEALSLADRIVVMRDGRVVQAGAPEDVYARPTDRWVAEFLGAAEILPATVDDAGEGGIARCELGLLPTRSPQRGPAEVVVRPEAIALRPRRAESAGTPATVVGREYFGHDQLVRVELGSGRVVRSRAPGGMHFRVGDEVDVRAEGDVWVVDAPAGDAAAAAPSADAAVGDQRPAAQPTA